MAQHIQRRTTGSKQPTHNLHYSRYINNDEEEGGSLSKGLPLPKAKRRYRQKSRQRWLAKTWMKCRRQLPSVEMLSTVILYLSAATLVITVGLFTFRCVHSFQPYGANKRPWDTPFSPSIWQSSSRKLALFEKKVEYLISQPQTSFDIVFSQKRHGKRHTWGVYSPPRLHADAKREATDIDFGGLDIKIYEIPMERPIYKDMNLMKTHFHDPDAKVDDDFGFDSYFDFDDDYQKSSSITDGYSDDEIKSIRCRRTSGHQVDYQNCNQFHEIQLIQGGVRFIGMGAYRQVFGLLHPFLDDFERFIMKDIRYKMEYKTENFEFVRMDAMVAERLTASPRIYDIYGYCGMSIISEYFPHGDMEKVAELTGGATQDMPPGAPLIPGNDLTPIEKLTISLQMAEALADLHGSSGGVITHQDIQLSQYLWNADQTIIKLNDFNRAEFMLFDEDHQRYCKYFEGPGNGNWRSPEEYFDHGLDEKVDVFALGNNMYAILTGYDPFYDIEDYDIVQEKIKDGEKAYIDPQWAERSLAERRLGEIIAKCHTYEADDRPSVFEIVSLLRDALDEAQL